MHMKLTHKCFLPMNKLSESNIVRLYNFLYLFEKEISNGFGTLNISDNSLKTFTEKEKILLGSMCQTNEKKISSFKYFILWDDTKPSAFKAISGNDSAYNLLRHIRNSIAHGNIFSENRQKFALEDYNKANKVSMKGKISNKLFFQLIDIIVATKH